MSGQANKTLYPIIAARVLIRALPSQASRPAIDLLLAKLLAQSKAHRTLAFDPLRLLSMTFPFSGRLWW